MKKTFLGQDRPLLTAMVLEHTADAEIAVIQASLSQGCDAIGLQRESLQPDQNTPEQMARIFAAAEGRPIYITNYRGGTNVGKTDEQLAEELLMLAQQGATLCDVMGDLFDPTPGELTKDPVAVEKQKEFINRLHAAGAEVLMSSHVLEYKPAERVLEIALAHQQRGADIAKIVTHANTVEQQIENLRITALLKKELRIPFLFLSNGSCALHRNIGCLLGSCMVLCKSHEGELYANPQPLIRDVKAVLEHLPQSLI